MRASFPPVADGDGPGRLPRPPRRSPFETALDRIEGRWRLLLVWHLFWGPCLFGELLRLTAGITDRALRQELQDLEACNLVRKERCAWDGRRVEYRLSPFGETLKPLLAEVYLWGLRVQESRPAAAAWGGGSS